MAQEAAVAEILKAGRRQLQALGDVRGAARRRLTAAIGNAGTSFANEQYRDAVRTLRRVVSLACQLVADGRAGNRHLTGHPDFHPDLPPTEKRHLLLVDQVALRLPFSYLHSLDRAAAHRPLEREEALLAVFAFGQAMGELAGLRRR